MYIFSREEKKKGKEHLKITPNRGIRFERIKMSHSAVEDKCFVPNSIAQIHSLKTDKF